VSEDILSAQNIV